MRVGPHAGRVTKTGPHYFCGAGKPDPHFTGQSGAGQPALPPLCQTKQPIDSWKQPIVCFGTITENCFVLWLSIKWFYNWIRSSFKCFDQALNAINSLFRFCYKQKLKFNQRKTNLSFSLILLLKSWSLLLRLLGSKRVWYRIFILYWFQIFSVTSVILCTFEENLCVKLRSVVCSWGCQDQHS